jgi:hypothetical protein
MWADNTESVLAMLRQRAAVNVPGYPNRGESEVGDFKVPQAGEGVTPDHPQNEYESGGKTCGIRIWYTTMVYRRYG